MPAQAPAAAPARIDAVYVRKSTNEQEEQAQIANVAAMLRDQEKYVEERFWFFDRGSRRKAGKRASFQSLLQLVRQGRVGTIYIEEFKRWGVKNPIEYFKFIGELRDHGTALFDLADRKALTNDDIATLIIGVVKSSGSEEELKVLAQNSLRTRVQNFKARGSWPTGPGPFGFGKRCCDENGKLKWEWQPVSPSHGQVFHADAAGNLTPGPRNVPIPRKAKTDVTTLVPSNNPDFVRAVRLVFDLFTRAGFSLRAIAARLNAAGLLFYSRPWTHKHVWGVLVNPAYCGDVVFGRSRSGELYSFNAKHIPEPVPVPLPPGWRQRPAAECIVKEGVHDGLVDKPTWEAAQTKLADERAARAAGRTTFSPRNAAYYLRRLFRCGHCGRPLMGRTEVKGGRRTVIYVCDSYQQGRNGSHPAACGRYRIRHDEAEKLLLDKVKELNLQFDQLAIGGARATLEERLRLLGVDDEAAQRQWQAWVGEGLDAFQDFLGEVHGVEFDDYTEIKAVRFLALDYYHGGGDGSLARFARGLEDVRSAVVEAERLAVERAGAKVAELKERHATITRNWLKATEAMQAVLKVDIDGLEAEIGEWEPRTRPLSERFQALYAAEAERQGERQRLLAEWPGLENREKGESFRKLFKSVTLYWKKEFRPAAERPTRPRTTNRPGRYSYHLDRGRIEWAYTVSDLGGPCPSAPSGRGVSE
jgi:DNA invertase Pin-like site-specific DNA recombinase